MKQNWTFTLPQGKGAKSVDVQSITIRETTGDDEEFAATLAEAKGKKGSVPIELIKLSLVKVDGKAAEQPFAAFDKWNSRTRKFVLEAFQSVNGVAQDENDTFLESATLDANGGAELVSV